MATTAPFRIGPPALPALRCGEQVFATATDQHVVTAQFALVWLLRGGAELRAGSGRARALAAGDAFHRQPEQVHSLRFAPGTRSLFIAVPAEGLALLRALGVPALDAPTLRLGDQPDLARRWLQLGREIARVRPRSLAALATRALELLAEAHQRAASGGDARLVALMERAAARLADPAVGQLRQPALARALGLSYRTFRRAFTAHAGVAPEAYRIRCRVAAAQELLRGTDLPMAEIAARLGYRDGADFARQFARAAGRSPSAYRRDDAPLG